MSASGSQDVPIQRVEAASRAECRDLVAVEEPMEVRVNGAAFAVIMRTPGLDRELAAGFLLAEDVIRGGAELATIEYCEDAEAEARGNTLNVTVTGDAVDRLEARLGERRQVMMTASCGLCGRRTIESLRARATSVQGAWTVAPAIVRALPQTLRRAQRVFETTGGLHAAGLFSLDGGLEMMAEDVGRHNAVDKIVGRRLLEDALPLDRCDPRRLRPHVVRAGAEGPARRRPAHCRRLRAIEPGHRPGRGGRGHPVRLRARRIVQRLRAPSPDCLSGAPRGQPGWQCGHQ